MSNTGDRRVRQSRTSNSPLPSVGHAVSGCGSGSPSAAVNRTIAAWVSSRTLRSAVGCSTRTSAALVGSDTATRWFHARTIGTGLPSIVACPARLLLRRDHQQPAGRAVRHTDRHRRRRGLHRHDAGRAELGRRLATGDRAAGQLRRQQRHLTGRRLQPQHRPTVGRRRRVGAPARRPTPAAASRPPPRRQHHEQHPGGRRLRDAHLRVRAAARSASPRMLAPSFTGARSSSPNAGMRPGGHARLTVRGSTSTHRPVVGQLPGQRRREARRVVGQRARPGPATNAPAASPSTPSTPSTAAGRTHEIAGPAGPAHAEQRVQQPPPGDHQPRPGPARTPRGPPVIGVAPISRTSTTAQPPSTASASPGNAVRRGRTAMPTSANTPTTSPDHRPRARPAGVERQPGRTSDATGAGTSAPSPCTTTPGMLDHHRGPRQQQRERHQHQHEQRRHPPPAGRRGSPGTTTNPASAYASSSRCTSGENAPITASPNAEDAAVDSHAAELVRDRPSSAMIPAVTGGTQQVRDHDVEPPLRDGGGRGRQQRVRGGDERPHPPVHRQPARRHVRQQPGQRHAAEQQHGHGRLRAADRREHRAEPADDRERGRRGRGGAAGDRVPRREVGRPRGGEVGHRQQPAAGEVEAEPAGVDVQRDREQPDEQQDRRREQHLPREPRPVDLARAPESGRGRRGTVPRHRRRPAARAGPQPVRQLGVRHGERHGHRGRGLPQPGRPARTAVRPGGQRGRARPAAGPPRRPRPVSRHHRPRLRQPAERRVGLQPAPHEVRDRGPHPVAQPGEPGREQPAHAADLARSRGAASALPAARRRRSAGTPAAPQLRPCLDEPALHAEPERAHERQQHEPRHADDERQQRAVHEERAHALRPLDRGDATRAARRPDAAAWSPRARAASAPPARTAPRCRPGSRASRSRCPRAAT